MTAFADWLEGQGGKLPGGSVPVRASRVPGVFKAGEIRVVFQPLVDLQTGEIFAYEVLVRSTAPDWGGPPSLFEAAIDAGCCGALGRHIRQLAVEHCPDWPLFLNIHPAEFDEGWLVRPDDPIFAHDRPIFLEITESVPLSHFHFCHSVLKEIRHKGILLAVDDLGAGYSNLKYIADLEPEVVKLDRELVSDLHTDPRRQVLVRAIVQLCDDLGARVVAEGVENVEELRAVKDTGAHLGQGYLLARPSFPPPPCEPNIFPQRVEPSLS